MLLVNLPNAFTLKCKSCNSKFAQKDNSLKRTIERYGEKIYPLYFGDVKRLKKFKNDLFKPSQKVPSFDLRDDSLLNFNEKNFQKFPKRNLYDK